VTLTRQTLIRRWVVVTLGAAAVISCGGYNTAAGPPSTAPAYPSARVTSSTATLPSSTDIPTPFVSASPSPALEAVPTGICDGATLTDNHFDPTLEAMFPSTIAGHDTGLGGSLSWLAEQCAISDTPSLFSHLNVTDPATVSYAIAYPAFPETTVILEAFRFPGQDPLAAFGMIATASSAPLASPMPTNWIDVPGRKVFCSLSGGHGCFYPFRDAMFYVITDDPGVAIQVVEALPAN